MLTELEILYVPPGTYTYAGLVETPFPFRVPAESKSVCECSTKRKWTLTIDGVVDGSRGVICSRIVCTEIVDNVSEDLEGIVVQL